MDVFIVSSHSALFVYIIRFPVHGSLVNTTVGGVFVSDVGLFANIRPGLLNFEVIIDVVEKWIMI